MFVCYSVTEIVNLTLKVKHRRANNLVFALIIVICLIPGVDDLGYVIAKLVGVVQEKDNRWLQEKLCITDLKYHYIYSGTALNPTPWEPDNIFGLGGFRFEGVCYIEINIILENRPYSV